MLEWFEQQIKIHGSQNAAARANGIPMSSFKRHYLKAVQGQYAGTVQALREADGRRHLQIDNGMVAVFSDGHFWPGDRSTAFRALVRFIEAYKPGTVICNGDAFDGASVSRWPSVTWEDLESQPSVEQEIKACQERLGEIEKVACLDGLFWTLGNHDARYEMRLLASAPQYKGLAGTRLKDHFPRWKPCWSVQINHDVMIKHRFRSGVHAGHNNTIHAGMTIVTGHTHQLECKPFSDYNGTRYGVQTGTLSDMSGKKFGYAEDNPQNHRSGFVILTFRDGHLLQPELVSVHDADHVDFRGKLWRV